MSKYKIECIAVKEVEIEAEDKTKAIIEAQHMLDRREVDFSDVDRLEVKLLNI